MNTLKLSQRNIHTDDRSSIEHLHDNKIEELYKYYGTIDDKKKELEILILKLEKAKQNKNYDDAYNFKIKIENLNTEIYNIENQTELNEYLLSAAEFMKSDETITFKEEKDNDGILKFINNNGKTNRGEKYNKYLSKCFGKNLVDKCNNNFCKSCNSYSRTIDTKNATIICDDCGCCDVYTQTIDCNDWSNYDSYEYVQIFTYKRKNHFKEWLTQLQAKESTNIPEEVLNKVYLELKKERITEIKEITYNRIRQYLKKLRLNKYYEHIPHIIKIITKQKGLIIDEELEKKLMNLFDEIQGPFEKYCPKNRKNFLSYSFTLYKFCQLLNRNDLLIYFPLLKSREKLFEQEKIWKNICKELNWEYISTI